MCKKIELGDFFNATKKPRNHKLTESEKSTLVDLEKLLDEQAQGATLANCASITYGGERCGFAKSGQEAYVINRDSKISVRVTIEVKWSRGGVKKGSYQDVRVISAGGKVYLGCTASSAIPVEDYSYRVVGCEKQ